MKTKISKREVAIFFLGIFTMLLIDVVWNWNDSVNAFKEGWNAGQNSMNTEISQ